MVHAQSGDRLDINLTPLLDLVLQLIMFFMLTVNFVRADQMREGIDLPVVQSAMPLVNRGDKLIYVHIGPDGQRLGGGATLETTAALGDYLRGRKTELENEDRRIGWPGAGDIVVVVRADKNAAWGAVWDTLAECRRAGFPSWQLRVVKQST